MAKPVDTLIVPVGTERTTARVDASAPGETTGVAILAHGAGGRMDHPTLVRLASALCNSGLTVVRFNFLYRALGQGPPDRMPRLQACYQSVIEAVRRELQPSRLLLAGHSMGGRAASMLVADGSSCDGLVLLSYPLHPAGKPQRLRDAHLKDIFVPVLCFNGTRDALCRRPLMETAVADLPNWTQHWLEGADHGYAVLKRSGRTTAEVFEEISRRVAEWLRNVS